MSVDNHYIDKLECFLRGAAKDRKDFFDLYELFIKPLKDKNNGYRPKLSTITERNRRC